MARQAASFEIVGSALYLKASTRKNLDFFCPPPPRADFGRRFRDFYETLAMPPTPDVSLPCSERTQDNCGYARQGIRTRWRGPLSRQKSDVMEVRAFQPKVDAHEDNRHACCPKRLCW